MLSARAGYLTAAAVLGGVVVAGAAWALPEREPHRNVTVAAAPAPAQPPVSVANPNYAAAPADQAIVGAAGRIASSLGLTTEPLTSPTRSNICGSTPTGWLNANEVRAVGPQTSERISVSVWRAGAASTAFKDLSDAASKCASVQDDPGNDRLVAVSSAGDTQQVVGAVRVGDTLTVVNTATLAGGAEESTWKTISAAEKLLKAQVAGKCLDPSTATEPSNIERDPFGQNYQGARKNVPLPVPVVAAIDQSLQRNLTNSSTRAVWQVPKPIVRNDLAPLAPSSVGGTLPAPKLIDPASVHPPLGVEPNSAPGDSPRAPDMPAAQANVRVPYEDVQGPGCGWKFANTTAPIYSAAFSDAQTQQLQLKALVATTRDQGNWLVSAASWPGIYQAWLDSKRTYADWQRYHDTLDQAKADLERARRRYADSFAAASADPAAPVPDAPLPSPPQSDPGSDGGTTP